MRPDGAGVVALQPHGQQQQALNILARMDPPGPSNPTPANPSPAATLRPVHGAALQRTLDRLSRSRSAPWLHAEVARRMAQRLGVIKLKPQVVLDWEARLGGGGSALRAAYAGDGVRPEVVHVDSAPGPTRDERAGGAAAPWWSPARWRRDGGVHRTPAQVQAGSAQLVWSNMALHAHADPCAVIAQWHRSLAVDGFLMFSTLGPGSLPELRALYGAKAWGPSMAALVDMHDLGDMLVAAGFADPVMDQEHIVLTWADADAALAELRSLGANLDPFRFAGLRTPRWRRHLAQGLREMSPPQPDGRVALTFEVAYGHAFRPPTRARVAPQVRVDLADFQAMARQGRR